MEVAETDTRETTYNEFSDEGNACRFVNEFGHVVRYVPPWKRWLVWDTNRWIDDRLLLVNRLATSCVEGMVAEALSAHTEGRKKSLLSWASKSCEARRLKNMVELAKPKVSITPESLDTDRTLFNAINGTLDLENGTMVPHNPQDLITKLSPVTYSPHAQCPTWLAFLDRIFDGDENLIAYVKKLAGYFLTGRIEDQIFVVGYGEGANGKSVFFDVLAYILGDYGGQAPETLLTASAFDSHPTEIADLHGKRLVVATETEEGRKLRIGLVKKMTGDSILKGRRMREDFFEFERTHKTVLVTNHRPVVKETKNAIWRRMHLIPFAVTIPKAEQDTGLIDKLKAEAPGILAWAVKGCVNWRHYGLNPPDAVLAATESYRLEQDPLAEFLAACCWIDGRDENFTSRTAIAGAYNRWAKAAGERDPLTRRGLYERLRDHADIREGKSINSGQQERGFRGIALTGGTGGTG